MTNTFNNGSTQYDFSGNYPVVRFELPELDVCEGFGSITFIRGALEFTGRERGEWHCFDVEAMSAGAKVVSIPEGPFKDWIKAQINGPQKEHVSDYAEDFVDDLFGAEAA